MSASVGLAGTVVERTAGFITTFAPKVPELARWSQLNNVGKFIRVAGSVGRVASRLGAFLAVGEIAVRIYLILEHPEEAAAPAEEERRDYLFERTGSSIEW